MQAKPESREILQCTSEMVAWNACHHHSIRAYMPFHLIPTYAGYIHSHYTLVQLPEAGWAVFPAIACLTVIAVHVFSWLRQPL